jgi:thioesterase domain-containing protein
VRDAVVVLREDAPGDRRLVPYLVLEPPGGDAVAESARAALRRTLPEAMVPARAVVLDELPLTPNGKVDRRALPAPEPARRADAEYLAPRDALELQLVRSWETLLRTRPIGVRDKFFAAGGHSLLMLRVVAEIERVCGVRVPLAELAQDVTVERLAALVRARRERSDERLVLMQPEGSGAPLFALVPAGGTLACYVALAEALGRERPFYALQPRGTLQEASAAPTVEQMARADLEELRRVQAEGPYLLVGWSMGGLVAYEIARLLREAGQEVALLAVLDAGVPEAHDTPRDATEMAVELGAAHLGVELSQLPDAPGEQRLEALLELARQRGLLAHEVDLRWVRWLIDGYRIAVAATQRYRPRPFPGRLVLLRAADHSIDAEETLGWGALAQGGVDLHWVPGTHETLVHAPHVQALAERLRACIEAAQSPSSPAGQAVGAAE